MHPRARFKKARTGALSFTQMNSLAIDSPAKVNLFLKITGRRKDGYHLLETLFHRVSLKDTLYLRKTSSGILIRTNDPRVPTDDRNLIAKAFGMLQKEVGIPGGVSVRLVKRIPMAGGMGGGSSNAAHFLLGMKRLYHLKISNEALKKIGQKLGADVNFFLSHANQALGSGAGERITPLPTKEKLWFVIVTMPKPLSTAKVYEHYRKSHPDIARHNASSGKVHFLTKKYPLATLSHHLKALKEGEQNTLFQNDLEASSTALYPLIRKALKLFEDLGIPHLISGSGPTVFGILSSQHRAKHLAKTIHSKFRPYKSIHIAHTV